MSDLDRDKLYTSPTDGPDSDDADLELEPLDPELLAAEQRRAAEALEAHRTTIDINEVYRDLDDNRDSEILTGWARRLGELRPGRFQFQTKHLLILTAAVALLLAFHTAFDVGFFTMLIIGVMLAVGGVSLYLKVVDNKRLEEANRRREKMYAERRKKQSQRAGQKVEEDWEPEPIARPAEAAVPTISLPDFRFQFSMGQLFMVITAAALFLGIGTAVGGASNIATLCGLLALAGLIVPALGLRPPDFIVFAWWMVLLVYVVLSLSAAIWTAFSAG
ncbi:MAG: hypothetical protein AB7U73_25775 [Pirellulales bacterium]